jgi:nicotinate-nucleotide--dimethylbenzimidazole phosphoribosyltransferase
MSQVLQHVIAAIGPASQANAEAVGARIAAANAPVLERLARGLAGAQHTPRPRSSRRTVVVVAADHGVGDPGIAMGADHPTVIAARAIADGSAALCQVTRAAIASGSALLTGATPIVLVDAGATESSQMPDIAVQLGRGPSRDLLREPAMTVIDAVLGLEAGIALSLSLCDQPAPASDAAPTDSSPAPDVLAVGALGVGSEVASAALLGALSGKAPTGLGDEVAEGAGQRGVEHAGIGALELLATFGGSDTAVLAGLMLGAASMNVPVILDSYATGTAALVAAALAPPVTGYLIAAHRGSFTHPAILEHLGLVPAFEVGLGHGEGTGAAMVLPLLDQVAALTARS